MNAAELGTQNLFYQTKIKVIFAKQKYWEKKGKNVPFKSFVGYDFCNYFDDYTATKFVRFYLFFNNFKIYVHNCVL